MAELDGLRIYALTDTQASYSSGIFLAVDDSGFSNTKKIALSTIYPKTNTLDAAGDFNPATTLVRTDNGSGVENKVTIDDLLSDSDVVATLKSELNLNTSELAFTGTPDAKFVVNPGSDNGKRYGNVSWINFAFSASSDGEGFLKTITGYISPGFTVFFTIGNDDEELDDSGWGQITTGGDIRVTVGFTGTWRFQATIINN